jgi:hypothetical protein
MKTVTHSAKGAPAPRSKTLFPLTRLEQVADRLASFKPNGRFLTIREMDRRVGEAFAKRRDEH